MKILVLGGCGYIGTKLVKDLLEKNRKVTVFDTHWFGNYLKPHKNLKIIKGDIRKIDEKIFKQVNTVVHLANIANDPGVDLNPSLSWEVNVLSLIDILNKCKKNKINQFIFSSSGSVYGIKREKKVTEDLDLLPISTYNKTKMAAERILLSYADNFRCHIIRPATVCGFSPRMRFDVSVNNLTIQALKKRIITVFGGEQIRPNVNINDISRIFQHFIFKGKKIKTGFYNAGFENLSILKIAKLVRSYTGAEIKIIKKNNDPRSYRLDSTKLINTGFKPIYGVETAIQDLISMYNANKITESDINYTVKWMKKKRIV
jgi:nucleoside-diphosphate-sugar epimerase